MAQASSPSPIALVASKSVASASLHVPLATRWHAYALPFWVAYPLWVFAYLFRYDAALGDEAYTFVSLAALISFNLLVFLACEWNMSVRAALTCLPTSDIACAGIVRIVPVPGKGRSVLCPIERTSSGQVSFELHKKRFIWDGKARLFAKLRYPGDLCPPIGTLRQARGIASAKDARIAAEQFGRNRFEIPIPTFQALFKEHAVAPFFVFQIFCVGLWLLDEYWYYSLFTLGMLIIFESTVVLQRLKMLKEFRSFSAQPYPIQVYRSGKWVSTSTDELLPGDICSVVRSNGDQAIPCDMALIDGSCIVNEAMLSGESTPQGKESIALREPEDVLDMNGSDRVHVLFGGTKVLQVTQPEETAALKTPDNGCVAFVLRTGFGTSQGKLVRTMVYNTEHVSVNSTESFLFILFLLMFAIAAAGYVWVEGSKNVERKKSKLILDCIMILTSVVPPELPMELSLAVNTSLIALSKYAIFCTEPFRIPTAGKVDICCFDKTGTLTGENLVVEGIVGLTEDDEDIILPEDLPLETTLVLAAAQGLVQLEDGTVVGDPMEKVTLQAIRWKLVKDTVVSSTPSEPRVRILRRFQFASALKRMSAIASVGTDKQKYLVAVKGAPETLRTMYSSFPAWYDDVCRQYTRRGQRVIALGYKHIQAASKEVNLLHRDEVESDLIFAGLLVFHCPLKPDSLKAVRMLNASSHRVVMITGDNPLTACHVAQDLEIVERPCLILDTDSDNKLWWKSLDDKTTIGQPTDTLELSPRLSEFDLCLTGRALEHISSPMLQVLVTRVWVYARVSPSQKEDILIAMKDIGLTTLMCGDGTNDVGALKQAHIGVALLDGTPEDLQKIALKQRQERLKSMYENQKALSARWNMPLPKPPVEIAHLYPEAPANGHANARQAQRNGVRKPPTLMEASSLADSLLADMDDEVPMIKFGDASVAAPFTSKLSTVISICNIIRQGRCTLVATIQMYKILALNCLISAYSLSVLYLDGIKYGDFQVTITGMLLAVCFLCISRAQPLDTLSAMRPQSNIFNFYIILSVLGQFGIHITSLIYVVMLAKAHEPSGAVDLDGDFKPSLLNTAVYLISLSMQVSTFAINYQGHPFRESIQENKFLYNGLRIVAAIALVGATEAVPDFNTWLQLVPFPSGFSSRLTAAIVLDFALAYLVERASYVLFADSQPKAIAVRATPTLRKRRLSKEE